MFNNDASPLAPPSHVAEGIALVERIQEGVGNYPGELRDADDEHGAQLLGYLREAAEALGVNSI